MTNDAELDMVSSRVSSLESRVASVESQGSPEDARVKAGQDGAPQPTVDPKGRKIWEAEWRQDYGVLIAYVPDNALVIDGANVEIEADDKNGDEVTVTAGSWYLHIYKNESGGGYSANFDNSATGSRDGETAKFNIKIFDIHEDGYVEKQFVVGSVVLVEREAEADEKSVDRNGGEDGENKLQIAHFNDTERDSGKGLEKRLKVDTKTGEVTAEDSEGLMLVGRKDGKVIYIPLTGDGEDPEEEPEEEKPTDPCDHDKGGGKEGGVSPDREERGGGAAGGGVSAGGVAGGGEKHKGDDDCNCK